MRQVLCLAEQPWSQTPSRTQQLMSRMEGAQVLFFEPPAPHGSRLWKEKGRQVRPNVIVYTLPSEGPEFLVNSAAFFSRYSHRRTLRFIQERLSRHHFREPLLWCASPAGAQFLEGLAYRGLVYDCARLWSGYPPRWEEELTTAADVVFAVSPDLARRLIGRNPNVTLLPQGCNYPMFAKDDLPRPRALRGLQGPVFGFVGTLWPDLDLEPVLRLARERRDCHILLIGRDAGCWELPEALELPNVHHLGQLDPVDLPDYLHSLDACLYLLRDSEANSDIIHARLFEYLSAGRPIVAMLRPDQVEHFPDVVYGAHTPAEFVQLCDRATGEVGTWARDRRREYGKVAAWSSRAEQVNRILESIGLFS